MVITLTSSVKQDRTKKSAEVPVMSTWNRLELAICTLPLASATVMGQELGLVTMSLNESTTAMAV